MEEKQDAVVNAENLVIESFEPNIALNPEIKLNPTVHVEYNAASMVIGIIVVAAAMFGGGYMVGKNVSEKADPLQIAQAQNQKAQAEAAKVINQLQVELQHRLQEVQMAEIKACTDKGRFPQFVQGNVTCP